jgi:predicted transcriptional regulator
MKKIPLDAAVLRDLIETQKLQHWKVAEILDVSKDTIERNCKSLGIETQRTGPRSGNQHTGWKGGVRIVKGYRYIYQPDHKNATKSGYVSEHRLAMEQKLGRLLLRSEVVHHLNNDPLDNRPENLGLYSNNAEHLRQTLKGQTPKWTKEGLEAMAEGLKKRTNQLLSGVGVPQRNQTTGRWIAKPDTPFLVV